MPQPPWWVVMTGGANTPESAVPPANATLPEEPPIPVPDGALILRTVHGQEYTYQYADMPRGWKAHEHFLSVSTPEGSTKWPWGSVLWFKTYNNSDRFFVARDKRRNWEALQKQLQEDEVCGDAETSA